MWPLSLDHFYDAFAAFFKAWNLLFYTHSNCMEKIDQCILQNLSMQDRKSWGWNMIKDSLFLGWTNPYRPKLKRQRQSTSVIFNLSIVQTFYISVCSSLMCVSHLLNMFEHISNTLKNSKCLFLSTSLLPLTATCFRTGCEKQYFFFNCSFWNKPSINTQGILNNFNRVCV